MKKIRIAIIGMGLIGQLTYKILESSGMFPIGIDIDPNHIKYVNQIGLKNVYDRKINFHYKTSCSDYCYSKSNTSKSFGNLYCL